MQKRGRVWGSLDATRRSQVAVEYLVIMAFVLIILLGIISLNQGLLDSFGGQFRASKARIAVDDLAEAADSVYIQGVGAQTRVFISLPKGINTSLISNRTLLLSLDAPNSGKNDIYRNLNFQVNGFLPKDEGNYWITVRAMSGYVMIGYALIDATPPGISLILGPGNSSPATILIRNVIDRPVGVILTSAVDPEFNLTLNQTSLVIAPNSTQAVLATISVPLLADEDTHTGTITLLANTTTDSQAVTIPVTVMVVGASCQVCSSPGIQLYPDLWDLGNITRYRLLSNTFYVCNNINSAQTVSLNFSLTSYIGFDPGTSTKTSSVVLGGKTCSAFQLYVNTTNSVPASYSTLLQAAAQNGSDASTILFNILNVSSAPIVNLITPANNFTSSIRDITFRYNVSSNFSIANCSLMINGAVNMTSANVARDVMREFNVTNLGNGNYDWTVRCTDTNGEIGMPPTRRLIVFSLSLFIVPVNAWEEDFDPRWTTQVQYLNDGQYATSLDEGSPGHPDYPPPDYVEFNFSAPNITGDYAIDTAILTIRHYEDIQGGEFTEDLRHEIDCFNGSDWQMIETWQWTPESNMTWIYYISRDLSSCINSLAPTDNIHIRMTYDPGSDTGALQYIDWAQIELDLKNAYYPFLWPMAVDSRHPVTFSSGLNTTGNTFNRTAGDDGWDWSRNAYGGSVNAASFNVDPNMDGNLADSTVAADKRLKIILGGGTPGAPSDPNDASYTGPISSGAYGVQFNITPEQYSAISSGGTAYLSFDWTADADGGKGDELDAEDEAWIKAQLITPTQTVWLGSSLDGGDDDRDNFNEIWWSNNPTDASGHSNIDVTSYITSAGVYYLDVGGMIGDWDSSSEAFGAYFDNIQMSIIPN